MDKRPRLSPAAMEARQDNDSQNQALRGAMTRLVYFALGWIALGCIALGCIALSLLEFILAIFAEQETQYLYEFTAEGAFLCPAGKQYEWN